MDRSRPLIRRIRLGLLLAACACAAARPGAAQAVTATSGSPEAIARIRADYAEIQREAPRYRRTTHDLYGFSLEGGEVEGFYRGSELRKLRARHYGETFQSTEEIFFRAGRPIFLHAVTLRYHGSITTDTRVRATLEDRFYFDGGRLIRHVRTQRPERGAEELADDGVDVQRLLKEVEALAACAAATGPEPAECNAPES